MNSIAEQLAPGDEVIVVGDTHDYPLPGVESTVREYGKQFLYLAHDAGHHCFGHCQHNVGLAAAQSDYIHMNDDDDVWTPDAAALMRKGATVFPGSVLLFRFRSFTGTIYWERVGLMERNHIGGHCLVTPNVDGKVGRFTEDYTGDFDWIESTVNAFGGATKAIWISDIVAIARP